MEEVLITFEPDPDERDQLNSILGPVATVRYLSDCEESDRTKPLRSATALVAGNLRSEVREDEYDQLASARLIQILPAGANRVPFEWIRDDIIIASNVGAYAEPMAEHVVAMILALAKDIVTQNEHLRQGEWDRSTDSRRVRGLTAGIIGFGGIGKEVARLLKVFETRIMALNRTGKTEEDVVFVGTLSDLKNVLSESDIIVLSLPLTRHTRDLIGPEELSWMREDAILINVARGALISESALHDRAASTPTFRVGLDVWWDEPFTDGRFATKSRILDLPNVIGSPHNSGHVPDMGASGARRAAENVRRYLEGGTVTGIVDRSEYV